MTNKDLQLIYTTLYAAVTSTGVGMQIGLDKEIHDRVAELDRESVKNQDPVVKRILDKIEAKTSWGKNELKQMILETVVERL